MKIHDIPQMVPLPESPRPIISIGAGGIVENAHLPAYRKAGFPVVGIFDLDPDRATTLAESFQIPQVFPSLDLAIQDAPANAVFDIAVPASALPGLLPQLPDGSVCLIQKPLGETLGQAMHLRELCRTKGLIAAVNFQQRFTPFVVAARHLIDSGAIGQLHSVDLRVTVHTPWHLWSFLQGIERLEILYHSIHYIDLVRSFLGEPNGVYARTTKHPSCPDLAATRTGILFNYGDDIAANIVTTHGHDFGQRHQESYIRWEGTRGAIVARMGVLMDYPQGTDDLLEVCRNDEAPGEWESIPLQGTWFPDAFIGTMASLMWHADDASCPLPTHYEDACRTMAVVEAAYASSAQGGTPIPDIG